MISHESDKNHELMEDKIEFYIKEPLDLDQMVDMIIE